MVGARPDRCPAARRTEKKGADRGIDGRITFTTGPKGEMGQALVCVKSGHVNAA